MINWVNKQEQEVEYMKEYMRQQERLWYEMLDLHDRYEQELIRSYRNILNKNIKVL